MRKTTLSVADAGRSASDSRPGRVGGASVAFGAPGPRIDLARVLGRAADDGATISGGADGVEAAAQPTPAPQTIALSDGTRIAFTRSSFAVAEPLHELEDA
jgi:hypothetical protein